MNYKTILVQIDNGKLCAKRLDFAMSLARQHDACLVGMYAFFPYTPPGYIMTQMGAEVIAAQQKAAVEAMAQAEKAFREQTTSAGLDDVEWHFAYEDTATAMSQQARYADLVVISQSDASDDSGLDKDFPERLILAAGRPVLVLPNAGDFPYTGKCILLAWNGRRESALAISNSIPFLKAADKVYVMSVHPKADEEDKVPCEQLVRYLFRHGVRVEVKESHGVEIDIGNELLSRASDLSADLLVMGCYGHSRLREWVLGGATRIILESMTLPVLMSH